MNDFGKKIFFFFSTIIKTHRKHWCVCVTSHLHIGQL